MSKDCHSQDHCGHETAHPLATSAHATLHCLTGCVIGEAAGLFIGVSMGIGVFWTIVLAFTLAYISGFTLALWPLMRKGGLDLKAAMRVVWLGELVSITVMEIAMNGADYWVGGIQASSVWEPIFWIGMGVAIVAGYLAAWPVNHWLLKKELKACHAHASMEAAE
ncbi:MAG TPA: hypothetical protein DCS82_14065 [Rhodospirillaceae bacterium]|nr:hypothetical protein [Rhodospirillaceae bacterium]HAT36837.1 hypothetical protein [Rhodospirillaceae bacterium]